MGGWRRISDTEAATERYEGMRHFMHDPRTVTTMDQELIDRATAAWEKHNAARRFSGGPDALRREFIAGYCAREDERVQIYHPDDTDEAASISR
jgi:hypothetical protein